jgi:mannose-6-phosphate isomerase-like protein (cupin superfamily)
MIDLESRAIRYADLRPCLNAFVDTRTPGSEAKENFTLIGPGVSENPDQYVHIAEPHGFNIGAARQPRRCVNSQHSHETAEVFVVHSGRWRFMWGPDATDGAVELGPGDTISLPTRMFRGFENIGTLAEVGFLFAVLGGDDPGKVTWSPKVFELAERYGLVLLEGGRLVDTVKGQTVPVGAQRQHAPTPAELAILRSPSDAVMASYIVRASALSPAPTSPLACQGVVECPIIGPKPSRDGLPPGPIVGTWPHGFGLRCLKIQSGARVPAHVRDEPEVLFVHRGTIEIECDGSRIVLGPGDTFTTPRGAPRGFHASSSEAAIVYVVRGGDEAGPVRFVEQNAA